MSGWEIHEYDGINALKFNESIKLPTIKSKTDVLVEVIATSINPLDQLMTGLLRTILNLVFFDFCVLFQLATGKEY